MSASSTTASKEVDLGPFTVTLFGSSDDSYFVNIQAFVSEHTELLNYAASNIKKDSICLDVGANIGATVLLLCKLCPDGHVYAFEPSPINAGYLRRNLSTNGVSNCTVIEAGLGAERATLNFHISDFGAGSHFVTDAHLGKETFTSTPIPVTTLDEFMRSSDAPNRIDFIKMDAEGFEPNVIAGGKNTIEKFSPPILMEFNSWSLYFAHRFDPYTFACFLWSTFDVSSVEKDGTTSPAGDGNVQAFLFYNMTTHGCVDDVVLELKPGAVIPSLPEMTGAHRSLTSELEAMRASTSWRITAPLRKLRTFFAS